ncbi:sensor histidine kinase [Frateuria hangzhouensis]|uniref:sensor histidine kinase n=1 Tax=Frateuria hangzhouensis TaxID=2995589 RepID=UPI002260AFD9|nr:ATP-binding protein [Frateuria sp. STR12]MCX7513969.1 ATP-binding protein [Frateuria sp. STR12]
MSTEPLSRRAGRMPRFERRVLYGSLCVAAPAGAALLAMALWPEPTLRWLLPLAALAATALAMRWQYRRVVFPLYTLGGLLEALREGDYSLRGVQGGVLGDVVYDINALAERLQKERLEFEESAHLLGKTLAALDSAVLVFDERLRLRLVNPAGLRLLDAERHRLFGLSAAELGLAGLLEGPAAQVLAHAFPGRSGRFEVRHAALRSGGRGGQLLVINDVGRVLREEERAAWQRLLRVLGHEVNNSLAPIQSMAGTLATLAAREPLPADWREDFRGGLEVIGNRAGALARFLAGYSTLARLPPPHRAEVDVPALLGKVARLPLSAKPAPGAKGARPDRQVMLEEGEPLRILADADQLEQALINLLRNAVEAASAQVRLRWRRESGRALIEVEDDGPGPPPSDNLFVPFFTTKPGGSGIGLALARQIAEGHDGGVALTARADGEPGALACLWLPLPAADPL